MTRIPLHPLLFALAAVLSIYASAPGQTHPEELAFASRAAIAVSAFLIIIASACYRDWRKAALLVSVLLVVLVAFDPLYARIEDLSVAGWRPGRRRYVLPLTYAAILAFAVWLYRWRGQIAVVTGFANMLALGAVLPPAATLGMARMDVAHAAVLSRSQVPMPARTPASKRDIYYLVFDRYGSDDTLRKYGLENDLDEYLTGKGFFVARDSRANYVKTVLSLASSLNLDYLDELATGRTQSADFLPIYNHVAQHRVGAFLRSQGYSYVHLGSWYWPTRLNPQATRNVNYFVTVPRAAMRVLDSVFVQGLRRVFDQPWFDQRRQNWVRVRQQVDDVVRLVPEPGPKFVLLHVLVPHPPYVFNADGRYVTLEAESRRSLAENYRNQIVAANTMIKHMVDRILKASATPPVIIVQGDEGPYPEGTDHAAYDWRQATAEQLRERSGVLNAYYLPDANPQFLHSGISPVNSFRIVFNTYFGTNLPLLPDRTFRHVSDFRPYALDDITRLVDGSAD